MITTATDPELPDGAVLIAGHTDYAVSCSGDVYSRAGRWGILPKWRKLKPHPGKRGYLTVGIRGRTIPVHLLVAAAFHGPCPDGMQCRHKDGRRHNCVADNLCWGTRLENANDKRLHGTILSGENHPGAKLTDADVKDIRSMICRKTPYRLIAKTKKISYSTVVDIARGRRRKVTV